MRKINLIVVHCTATPYNRNISVAQIDAAHRARGFAAIGYHYLISLDGTVHTCRPIEQPGAHAKGYNSTSVGVAYVGGLAIDGSPYDTRTPAQRTAMRQLLIDLKKRFPGASIIGHRDVAAKACPCFDATTEYKNL